MNDLWGDLVAAAVLGVERRPLAAPQASGPLGDTLARISQDDREGALLSAAATISLYQRAGWVPPADPTPPVTPSPPDAQSVCPPRAAQRFSLLLEGTHRALLPEWLAVLAATGCRLPDRLLPDLLDLARTASDVRPYLTAVIGQRGRWLAGQNRVWHLASDLVQADTVAHDPAQRAAWQAELTAAWTTGSVALRGLLLTKARELDPDFGRELLSSTWSSDKAADRSALLDRLTTGLSMADEPLLESTLDDRSKEVRQIAVKLLLRLPESRLVARMIERTDVLLEWVPGEKPRLLGLRPGQPARINIKLPTECDKAMQRDGVDPKSSGRWHALGDRSWWLMQMLSAVPPAHWTQRWGASPTELLDAASAGEWSQLLNTAWSDAALTFSDQTWAAVLVQRDPERAALFAVLPSARQERWLLDLLAGDCVPLHEHPVFELLKRYSQPWSHALARAFLGALYQHMRRATNSYDYALRSALTDQFARQFPPDLAPEIAAGWPKEQSVRDQWHGSIERLLVTLQFRHDMLEELRLEA